MRVKQYSKIKTDQKQYGEAVQHIRVKNKLRLASEDATCKEISNILLNNKKVLDSFNDSIFSSFAKEKLNDTITNSMLEKAIKNPASDISKKIAYGVSGFLANPDYVNESKIIYEHFRNKQYDAIPDIYDGMSGTSKTPMIIINPDKIELTSSTMISKDIMKTGKQYVKTLEKLQMSDPIV